jgi:hypothetical protein
MNDRVNKNLIHGKVTLLSACLLLAALSLAATSSAGPISGPGGALLQDPQICNTNADCFDGNPCTIDICFFVGIGVCVYQPVSCDDGDPCTLDTCEPDPTGYRCVHTQICHTPTATPRATATRTRTPTTTQTATRTPTPTHTATPRHWLSLPLICKPG